MGMDHFRRRALLAVGASLTLFLAACGSSNDSSTNSGGSSTGATDAASESGNNTGLAAAKKNVADHSKPPAKIGPTVPIGKPIPKGKKLVFVYCGAPACLIQGESFKEAAKLLGWSVSTINAAPTPEAAQKAMDEAIRRNPDGVASSGLGSTLYPQQLKKLNDMKIPVISATGGDETGTNGITLDPLGPKKTGEGTALAADKAIVDMNGEGEIGVVHLGGFPIVENYTKSFEDEIKKNCSKCTIKTVTVQPTSLGKDAAQIISNFLRKNPNVKHLFLSYDLEAFGLPAAVKGAGGTMPKTYSWGVESPGIQDFKNGTRSGGLVPDPFREGSWQMIDGFARLFTGRDVNESATFQPHIVWAADLNNLPAKAQPFPPVIADYKQQFMKLWGVQ
jgi:ABC-type sugar transport system substrate-binding protein